MDIDIDKINTYGLRNKVNTIKWRPIYEAIYEAYFIESKIFSDAFMQQCKDNVNDAKCIPLEMKNSIKRMEMEQLLYAQVVNILRKDLKFVAADKNKNEAKLKFQGRSTIQKRWFDLEFDWIEVNFSTHEPDLYKNFFQIHDNTQDTNIFKSFKVPIGNAKCVESFKFHNDAPILMYCHKSLNSCHLSSLASDFVITKKIKAANDTALRIE